MRSVSSRLLFGRPHTEFGGESFAPEIGSSDGGDRKLLVRCEDYKSFLYSPLLKTTSCRHEDEEVTYEQRRCGDEIHSEIRTCKKCGSVRVTAN